MGNKQSIKSVQSDGELVRDDSDVISVQSTISLSSTGTTGNGGTTMGKTLEMTRRYQHLVESGRHRTVAMSMRAAVVERVMKCIGATLGLVLGLVMKCIGATLGVLCCLSQEDRALLAEGSAPLPRQREQGDVEIAGAGAVADGSDALPPPNGREQDNVVENAGTSTATAHRSVPNEAVIATPPVIAPASASRDTLPGLLEGQNVDGEEKAEKGEASSGLLGLGIPGEGSSETSMSGHNFDNGALPSTE